MLDVDVDGEYRWGCAVGRWVVFSYDGSWRFSSFLKARFQLC